MSHPFASEDILLSEKSFVKKGAGNKITNDDIFKEIGEFGKYQLLVCFLLGWVAAFNGIGAYQTAFIDATPQFRCSLPNYENDTYEIASQDHQELIDRYIPRDPHLKTYKSCTIRNSADLNATEVPCNSWVYSKEYYERTIVTEWDLVCDNIKEKGIYKSVFFFGTMSIIIIGFLGDRFGRKRITYIFRVLNVTAFILMALSVNLITEKQLSKVAMAVLRFFIGCTINVYSISLVLALELVGPNYRLLANNFMYYFYIFGELVVLVLFYFVRDYRYFSIYIGLLSTIFLAYYWYIPESVRYLIAHKKYPEADAIFKRIAKSNRKVYTYSSAELNYTDDEMESEKKKLGFTILFTNPKLLKNLIVTLLQWFTNDFIYYGISINADVLDGNPYVIYFIMSIAELIGVGASHYMLNRFGRKTPYFINFILIAISLLSIGFIPANYTSLIIICILIAKCLVSFNFNAIYIIAAETFPTVIRSSSLSFCGIVSQTSSTLSPIFVALVSSYSKKLMFVIYGVMSVFAGITFYLFITETKDVSLPEQMSDIVKLKEPIK